MTHKQKALQLSVFYSLLAQNDNGFKWKNSSFIYGENGPHMGIENISDFQVNPPKPVLQTIDLSMMVGSDILMEFKEYHNYTTWQEIGFLNCIGGQTLKEYYYEDKHLERWKCCRIMQDHWHLWKDGECSLPEGLDVIVSYDGRTDVTLLSMKPERDWTNDIMAFKVLGPAEGWEYEWDKYE